MIDQNSQFFAILTHVGMAKQANADALGIPWNITELGVGDANGTDPIPDAAQTRLINEWRRRPLNQLKIDPINPAVIIAEQVIPADEGGKWIREIGLYDADGDLVAVANCAPSFKPVLSQGSGRTQVVRMNLIVSSAGNISLKIDPAVVLATRTYVDSQIQQQLYKLDSKQSVRAATTANIALAGLQTIDAVALVAGDRVLVKNQAQGQNNGIYLAGPDAWKRSADADNAEKVTPGLLVTVERGQVNADSLWLLATDGAINVGATELVFRNITDGLAPLASPVLTGTPKAPTPPVSDHSQRIATTAFVKSRSGSFSTYSLVLASRTLTPEEIGGLVWFGGNYTLSLPKPSALGVPIGGSFNVMATSAGGRVQPLPGTVIQRQDGFRPTFYRIESGQSARFVALTDSEWLITDSTASLETNYDFRQSKTTNGYQYLPGGLLECWGISAVTTDKVSVTFPEEFYARPFVVPYDSTQAGALTMTIWQMTDITPTGFTAQNMCTLTRGDDFVGSSVNSNCYWRAFGWVNK
jgi:hypothetical protein